MSKGRSVANLAAAISLVETIAPGCAANRVAQWERVQMVRRSWHNYLDSHRLLGLARASEFRLRLKPILQVVTVFSSA